MKLNSALITAVILTMAMVTVFSCGPKIPKSATVKIERIDAWEEWRPSTVEIAKGGSVTWNNTSTVLPHSIISLDGLFNSNIGAGQTFSYTFNQTGTFTYRDTPNFTGITEDFVGTIHVK